MFFPRNTAFRPISSPMGFEGLSSQEHKITLGNQSFTVSVKREESQCFQEHYFRGFNLDEVIDGNELINGKVVIGKEEIPLFVEEEPSLKPNPELNNLVEIDGVIKGTSSRRHHTHTQHTLVTQKPAPLEEIQSYDRLITPPSGESINIGGIMFNKDQILKAIKGKTLDTKYNKAIFQAFMRVSNGKAILDYNKLSNFLNTDKEALQKEVKDFFGKEKRSWAVPDLSDLKSMQEIDFTPDPNKSKLQNYIDSITKTNTVTLFNSLQFESNLESAIDALLEKNREFLKAEILKLIEAK